MARLVYTGITSLDGYTIDAEGGFAWAEPDEELHALVNDLERHSAPTSSAAGSTRRCGPGRRCPR